MLKCAPGGGDSQKGLHFTRRSSLHGRTRFATVGPPRGGGRGSNLLKSPRPLCLYPGCPHPLWVQWRTSHVRCCHPCASPTPATDRRSALFLLYRSTVADTRCRICVRHTLIDPQQRHRMFRFAPVFLALLAVLNASALASPETVSSAWAQHAAIGGNHRRLPHTAILCHSSRLYRATLAPASVCLVSVGVALCV